MKEIFLAAWVIPLVFVATSIQSFAQESEICVCIKKNGEMFLSESGQCKPTQSLLCWNLEGPQGPQGEQDPKGGKGDTGDTGATDQAGTDGLDGLHCWDLDADRECDPEEDKNNDGMCNALDWQGEPVYGGVPQTGQQMPYASRDDGHLQMGVVWPGPRFTDNSNGTVTDNLTGLIWLKDAMCQFKGISWSDAVMFANSLYDGWTGDGFGGDCGLSDGSSVGDWRLPNTRELLSLIDFGRRLPALPSGHPFTVSQDRTYWSSTSDYDNPTPEAWAVNMGYGDMNDWDKSYTGLHVWAVRGAN